MPPAATASARQEQQVIDERPAATVQVAKHSLSNNVEDVQQLSPQFRYTQMMMVLMQSFVVRRILIGGHTSEGFTDRLSSQIASDD
mmetsp:Transcript_6376/g.17954  ORF Transcript_6376/g.17954 Transcript_6376/m.17954 type:complete len:86 (+) Transcript_6376:69-326(+)